VWGIDLKSFDFENKASWLSQLPEKRTLGSLVTSLHCY